MDRMIYTALNALQVMKDARVSQSQNLAALTVPGFRRDLPNEGGTKFVDMMGAAATRAFQIETGPATFSEQSGRLDRTGLETDIAIADQGYFYIQPETGEPALSRRGDLQRGVDGILRDGAGAMMLDAGLQPLAVPAFRKITVTDLGEVMIEPIEGPGGVMEPVGILATVVPEPGARLLKGADGEIRLADGTVPAPNQGAKVLQGVLEMSNVNPVEEMLASIEMQRAFEIGMRTIMSARELDEAGTRLMRPPES